MSAHVLVVGASPELEGAIAEALTTSSCHPEWVSTLREVADQADVAAVVVCLTTARSVRSDLAELTAFLRGSRSSVPVVAVAVDLDVESRLRCGIEGVLEIVEVPFGPAELADALSAVVGMDAAAVDVLRREVRASSLAAFAHWERTGNLPDADGAPASERVRITRLGRSRSSSTYPRHLGTARAHASRLTVKQRELLQALASGEPVSHVAADLGMSRSNVYTSLRRIGRRLGIDGTSELLGLAREGAFGGP